MSRPRVRTLLLSAGAAVWLLLVAAWGITLRWPVSHDLQTGQRVSAVGITYGEVWLLRIQPLPSSPNIHTTVQYALPAGGAAARNYGLVLPTCNKGPVGPYSTFHVSVPIWLLLLAIGLPTCALYFRRRRRRPGHCVQCDYDLTGNVTGVCPECGLAYAPDTPSRGAARE